MDTEKEYLEATKRQLAALDEEQAAVDLARQKEDEKRARKREMYRALIAELEGSGPLFSVGKPLRVTPPSIASLPLAQPIVKSASGRVPKGAADEAVEALLCSAGGEYTLNEVRNIVSKNYRTEFGASTIHRALDRGRSVDKYKFVNGKWSAVL